MYKLVTYAGYDNRFGPHIFPIEPDLDRSIGHIKMARELPEQIENYIRSAKPSQGKTQLLIDAMGSSDFYGSNVNGDWFGTSALDHKGPDYGYETFMHYAYPYKFHVNKDVARAYGDKVTLSAYDRGMHRVLLIVSVDDQKCQDILNDLANNKYWDVSMGCRVPFDVCKICQNRARNRAEYCPHLRYQMNKILPDGRRVCADNTMPKFFDISFVPIGAEKASHVLAKVAHEVSSTLLHDIRTKPSAELGEIFYDKLAAAERKEAADKAADIRKNIPTSDAKIEGATPEDKSKLQGFMDDAAKVKADEPGLPPALLNQLGEFPLKDVFATLAAMGIDLRPEEFQRIVLVKQGAKPLAEKLAQHRLVFDVRQAHEAKPPRWSSEYSALRIEDAQEKIAHLLRPYLRARSCYPEVLADRLAIMEKSAGLDEIATALNIPDASATGYQTNSQWYPMTEQGKRLASAVPGIIPASIALAGGFLVFRHAFPGFLESGPSPVAALAKHPWLLPLLIGAGVGASVGMSSLTANRPLTAFGTGSGLDDKKASAYHHPKLAGIDPLCFGPIPLAYIQAGVQQKMMGQSLTKHAAEFSTARSSIDVSIFESVRRLARRKDRS